MNNEMLRKTLTWMAAVLLTAIGAAYAFPGGATASIPDSTQGAGRIAPLSATHIFMGGWVLNRAKSKIVGGAPKNSVVVCSLDGDNVKCIVDTIDASGQRLHTMWTGRFDGKEYPVTVSTEALYMRSYRMINSHTLAATETKGGKVFGRADIVVSADGNSRTVTTHGEYTKGFRTASIAVYEKQE